MVSGFELKLVKSVREVTKGGGAERLAWVIINPLRVARRLGIKKAQEKQRVDVVVSADRALVCVDLPEQERLDKPPSGDKGMEILHGSPEFKRTGHVTVDIDIAGEIGASDPTFVDTADCPQTRTIFDSDAEAWLASPRSAAPSCPAGRHRKKPVTLRNG